MTDDEIIALANAVSAALRALADATDRYQADAEIAAAKYTEFDGLKSALDVARRQLSDARAALEAGLATR